MPNPQPPPPSIAIIGAGPAGLTLARLLQLSLLPNHHQQLSLTIYEHAPSATSRQQQGGTLDLHPDGGLLALKRMGLYDAARKWLRYEGEELVIADLNGCELVHMKDAPPPAEAPGSGNGEEGEEKGLYTRPEIDRERLMEVLLGGVGEENVRWGKHLKRVDEVTRRLEFEDGSVEGPFDLVVGADGAWSKVRKVLDPDLWPAYSGICGVEGHILEPAMRYPRIEKLVGRGSYFSFTGRRACMAQRMGDGSIKVGMWFRRKEEWVDELVGEKIDEPVLRQKLLEEYKDWCPEIRELVEVSQLTRKWKLYELPVGSKWAHKKGYTLIGDSAHLATPFAGIGVNAAMLDSLQLCDAITKALTTKATDLDAAVKDYETTMFPRARDVQHRTMINKTNGFGDNAPIGFITGMIGVVFNEMGKPIDRGILYWIPITRMATLFFWTKTCFTATRRWFRRAIWGEKSLAR